MLVHMDMVSINIQISINRLIDVDIDSSLHNYWADDGRDNWNAGIVMWVMGDEGILKIIMEVIIII